MRIRIKRQPDQEKQTLGNAQVLDNTPGVEGKVEEPVFEFVTIELAWLNNERGVSCIPPGVYRCRKYQSPTHGECFLITDVPERSMCEMHAASFSRQLRGCIAPGEEHVDLDGDGLKDVNNSRQTLEHLLELLPDEFELEII